MKIKVGVLKQVFRELDADNLTTAICIIEKGTAASTDQAAAFVDMLWQDPGAEIYVSAEEPFEMTEEIKDLLANKGSLIIGKALIFDSGELAEWSIKPICYFTAEEQKQIVNGVTGSVLDALNIFIRKAVQHVLLERFHKIPDGARHLLRLALKEKEAT